MEEGRLTNHQTVTLARAISQPAMESIALGYLGIEQETIDSYRAAHRENTEAFNREILRLWRNKHGGDDQIQVGPLRVVKRSVNRSLIRLDKGNPENLEEIISNTSGFRGRHMGHSPLACSHKKDGCQKWRHIFHASYPTLNVLWSRH